MCRASDWSQLQLQTPLYVNRSRGRDSQNMSTGVQQRDTPLSYRTALFIRSVGTHERKHKCEAPLVLNVPGRTAVVENMVLFTALG